MTGQNLLEKNLKILLRLDKGNATLEELAETVKLPTGFLSIPLRVLKDQYLVQEKNGYYSLVNNSIEIKNVLGLVSPWLDYKDNSYLEIAKDVARIILTKSHDKVNVKDVLLFGSTLRNDRIPNDIDLVILHMGDRLAEFNVDPYGKHHDSVIESDQPVGNKNMRLWTYGMLKTLGYKGDINPTDESSFNQLWDAEIELEKDSAFHNIIKRVADIVGDVEKYDDAHVLDNLFDIHALSANLLISHKDEFRNRLYGIERKEAIQTCRDPTFWHTVLSEGRLYDMNNHDFSIRVDDKYSGAADLFKN